MAYETQLKTTAQSIVTLFAKTGNQSTVNPVVDLFSNFDSKLKTEMDQALKTAVQNQKQTPTESTQVLVSNAVSNIASLLEAAQFTSERIQGLQQKIAVALAPGKPNDMTPDKYNALIKDKLIQITKSASHGGSSFSQQTKGDFRAKK